MKKIFLALVALFATMNIDAQTIKIYEDNGTDPIASYSNGTHSYKAVFEETQAPSTTGTAEREGGISVNWVQLWAGGPKFAEYNVGVTDGNAESYGDLYAWGGSQDKVDDHNTGTDALSGDSDTAYKLWGSNWRMPTKDELASLISNDKCTRTWCDGENTKYNSTTVKGLLVTGNTTGYTGNSIFLPAAGFCDHGTVYDQGSNGHYWSSTPDGSNKYGNTAYDLTFDSKGQNVYSHFCYSGYSVRAVYSPAVAVTGVSLNKTTTTIKASDEETLTATIAPADATNKTVNWVSSNTAVATVDTDGKVTGVAEGTAYIYAIATDGSGISAVCTVTVNAAPPITGTAKATIGEQQVDVNWVQLWENGPKFAEYNIGAENNKAEDYGGYYTWGGSENVVGVANPTYNDGTVNLSGETDTAYKLWGENWRMPTKDELASLLSNDKCTRTWCDGVNTKYNNTTVIGFLVTGNTTGYTSNSIFLPAAGLYKNGSPDPKHQGGSEGDYWSSTLRDDNDTNALWFSDATSDQAIIPLPRYDGLPIRAVLNEQ